MDDEDPLLPFDLEHPTRAMKRVALGLARAFLAADPDPTSLRTYAERALGRHWPWLPSLVLRAHHAFGRRLAPLQLAPLQRLILDDAAFAYAFFGAEAPPRIRAWFPVHPQMDTPAIPGLDQRLPPLATLADLADWLELDARELDWFADPQAWRAAAGPSPVEHYRHHWRPKRDGSPRLIEAPKPRLRSLQRRILHGLLDLVPIHHAATGCVRGRSVVDNAIAHANNGLLIKLDLRDFFPGIRASRIHALFRSLGYPPAVARYLTGLTTHRSPPYVLRALPVGDFDSPEERFRQQRRAARFSERHLPQGAPTSPALANLCAYRLDLRLAGAAAECGARYTRYVDDLSFSGPFDTAHGRRMLRMVDGIVREEGFEPNWRKTGVFPSSARQQVTGIVINRHPNLPRQEYDRLKAVLTNCRRHGPASQNRDKHRDFRAHLLGRIAWVRTLNPTRGEKLQTLFARIDWN